MYFLKSNNEVFGRFKEWKTMVEKRTKKHVKTLRTNNGLEFCNASFDELWYDTSSYYFGSRIFGCPAYTHVNDDKLEPRQLNGYF